LHYQHSLVSGCLYSTINVFTQFSYFDGGIHVRRFYFDVLTEFLLRDQPRSFVLVVLDTRRRSQ